MEHKNYKFCKKRTVTKTDTSYYSCTKFHAGCTARLVAKKGVVVEEKNRHSCEQGVMVDVADVRHDISLLLQEHAVKELAALPALLWHQVYNSFRLTYPSATLNGISRTQGVAIIENASQGATGGDVYRAIESAPVRCVSDSDVLAVQHDDTPSANGIHRMLGFAHPDIVRIIRSPQLTLFIDAAIWSLGMSPATSNLP